MTLNKYTGKWERKIGYDNNHNYLYPFRQKLSKLTKVKSKRIKQQTEWEAKYEIYQKDQNAEQAHRQDQDQVVNASTIDPEMRLVSNQEKIILELQSQNKALMVKMEADADNSA